MSNDIKVIIGNNIIKYLEKAHRSQIELAEYLGVSRATVSYWCKGQYTPRMDKLEQIAEFLHTSTFELMHEDMPTKDEALQMAFDRPEMRMLFSVAKDATTEDILNAIKVIEALKK